MRTSMMESVELHFPEGRIIYGHLACPDRQNPVMRHGTKLVVITVLLASIEDHSRQWNQLRLTADALGNPRLATTQGFSPPVSFSWGGGHLWATVGFECTRLGMDTALPQDFPRHYPFARVFGEREWRQAGEVCGSDAAWRAAMLWSAKEAATKMLGWGFHFTHPQEVTVSVIGRYGTAWRCEVRVPIGAMGRNVVVYSREQSWGWISFSLEMACSTF